MTSEHPIQRLPDLNLKKKRKGALVRVFASLLGWGVFFGLLLTALGVWSYMGYVAPGPLAAPKVVIIPENAGRSAIATQLQDQGIITDARIMGLASLVQGLRGASLKPGEYQFPAGGSMAEAFNIMASGKVVMHKLTVPEGWTSAMAVARMRAHEAMAGELIEVPPEGAVIANTFLFARGKDRKALLDEMVNAQTRLVDEVWTNRQADSIITTKNDLVTLASIVEKETAKVEERPRVAAVFLNRLKAGMRLQSDPTIIYGMVGGLGRLNRSLTRSDIDTPTPYNTYTINGLPPGPIASPGKAALEAVLNPAKTADIYFVADGTGGHVFAETLEQHNENVKKWREIEAQGGKVAAQSDAAAPVDKELLELQSIQSVVQPALPDVVVEPPSAPVDATDAAAVPVAPVSVTPPTVPAPVAEAAPEAAVAEAAEPVSSTIILKPGTVMDIGGKKIPIPALKRQP